MKKIRIYYQIFFLSLFFLLLFFAAQGRLKGYPVTLLLDSSPLNALSTLFSSWNVAHTMWIGFAVLALSFFLGRFFCSFICPLGTIFHFISWLSKNKKISNRILKNKYSFLQIYKYGLLIVLLTCALFGGLQIGLFDPIDLLTRTSAVFIYPTIDSAFFAGQNYVFPTAPLIVGFFTLLLILNVYRPRFWCRYVCPLGALLGLASKITPGALVRDENKCTNCGLCTASCVGACEPEKAVIKSECLMCFNCVDVCPEKAIEWKWIIPKKTPLLGEEGCPKGGVVSVNSTNAGENPPVSPFKKGGINRRLFVGSVIGGIGAFFALRLSGSTGTRGYAKRVRPPGSLNEEEFLSRCLKCGECVKICPTNAIQPAISEAGIEGFLSPVMKMEIGYCELNCTLCGQVCPTGAIERLKIADKVGGEEKRPVKIGTAFVDRNRCIPWTLGRECLVCQEVCPVSPKAIYEAEEEMEFRGKMIKIKRPYVDYEKCIGCGICQHECPITDKAGIRVTSVGESRAGDSFIL
ncbi:4Fe-4S binding protein [bacterium]|nr:4Fe-4S binding protein [bacterium]